MGAGLRIGILGMLGVLVGGLGAAGVGCELRSERGGASPSSGGAPAAAEAPARERRAERPASGRIHGQPFTLEEASLDGGILELRQGGDLSPDRAVLLFLFLDDERVVPEGRRWDVDCRDGWSAGDPHIHVRWQVEGQSASETGSVVCGYRLRLELGRETAEGRLPGRIRLAVPELDTELAGRFEARIEGFRMVDGEPDLTQDDLEVLRVVAERWLARREGGPVEITDAALASLQPEAPEGGVQSGFGLYWWRPERSARTPEPQKLRFAKRDGTWQVHAPLESWQLRAAHPVNASEALSTALVRRAARRVEEAHRAAHGETPLTARLEGAAYNPKTGLAEIELRVHRGETLERASRIRPGEPGGERIRTLFRTDAEHPAYLDPDSWRLERRLEPGEEVDFEAGRVVHR